MRCSKCGFENPVGMRFCGHCIELLALVCPRCRFHNPPGFKFCGQCAAALSVETGAPTSRTSAAKPFEAVRVAEEEVSETIDGGVRPAWLRSPYFLPLALLALTMAMFAGPLLWPGDQILSSRGTDLATQFVYWRPFAFEHLRAGHLALWDPHVFGGLPFLGDFQSAVLYPPNWIYLVLPLAKAINLEIALHVFLFGLFISIWARRYKLHPLAVLFASAVSMFGGAFFFHIYAGHLATVDAMAWTPLIYCTVDELADDLNPKWLLVGIFAVAMQLLAGFPQSCFNTFVACALYGGMRLVDSPRRFATVTALACVGIGAAAICTVQLWTGFEAASEGTRQGGAPFQFAAMFSFPPENLVTLVVPGFFGDMLKSPYWARCYLWEVNPFFGIAGLTMAIFGAVVEFRKRVVWIVMPALLFVLALGSHTPLFALLYNYVPGFDHFRAHAKFIFQAVPFLALLAAVGAGNLLRSSRGTRAAAAAILVVAIVVGTVGVGLYFGTQPSGWNDLITWVWAGGDSYFPHGKELDPGFIANARTFAGSRCLISAAIMLALAAIVWLRRFSIKAAYALIILGIAEVFVFAHSTIVTFKLADTDPIAIREFLGSHRGDYRILAHLAEGTVGIGADDIWGYNPMVLRRYAELLTFSQHTNPNTASEYLTISNPGTPLLRLVRLRYVFRISNGHLTVAELGGALPHLLLVNDWKRLADRDTIFNALTQPPFEADKTVILETDPTPAPVAGGQPGAVELLDAAADSLTISASVEKPTLLLITDSYSRYFRAVSLPTSSQSRYDVLPADYALMAIPLAAGKHLLRLEYAPPGYLIGRWISMVALAAYILAVGAYLGPERLIRRIYKVFGRR
jgi:hypothetical protein